MSETIELPDDGAERKEQVKRQALVSLIESNPLRYGWLRECISDTPASPPDELAALRERVQELEAVLTPFAAASEDPDVMCADGNAIVAVNTIEGSGLGILIDLAGLHDPMKEHRHQWLRVCHLRAAADALAKGKQP